MGVRWILLKFILRRRKGAAQPRFVNKVDSKFHRVISCNMADVVAELIFILIAQGRKQSDGSGKLIVAEGFKAGDGQGSRTEGERHCKAEIRVTRLREM